MTSFRVNKCKSCLNNVKKLKLSFRNKEILLRICIQIEALSYLVFLFKLSCAILLYLSYCILDANIYLYILLLKTEQSIFDIS